MTEFELMKRILDGFYTVEEAVDLIEQGEVEVKIAKATKGLDPEAIDLIMEENYDPFAAFAGAPEGISFEDYDTLCKARDRYLSHT